MRRGREEQSHEQTRDEWEESRPPTHRLTSCPRRATSIDARTRDSEADDKVLKVP